MSNKCIIYHAVILITFAIVIANYLVRNYAWFRRKA